MENFPVPKGVMEQIEFIAPLSLPLDLKAEIIRQTLLMGVVGLETNVEIFKSPIKGQSFIIAAVYAADKKDFPLFPLWEYKDVVLYTRE